MPTLRLGRYLLRMILFLVPAISLFFINSTLIKIVGVLLLLIGVFGTFVGVSEQIALRNSKK